MRVVYVAPDDDSETETNSVSELNYPYFEEQELLKKDSLNRQKFSISDGKSICSNVSSIESVEKGKENFKILKENNAAGDHLS